MSITDMQEFGLDVELDGREQDFLGLVMNGRGDDETVLGWEGITRQPPAEPLPRLKPDSPWGCCDGSLLGI